MAIKTNISIEELMRLNPSIKDKKQAAKILHTVKTAPSISLDEMINKKICSYCLRPIEHKNGIDHFIPRSKNGSNEKSNLIDCCRKCNAWKNDRIFKSVEEAREIRLRSLRECPNCASSQKLYRIKSKSYVCRVCGNEWKKEKTQKEHSQ